MATSLPAEAPQLLRAHGQDVAAAEADAAAGDHRGVAQQSHDRVGDRGLAAAGFAGEPEYLAGADAEGDAVDGGGGAGVAAVLDGEVLDLQDGLGAEPKEAWETVTGRRSCCGRLDLRRRDLPQPRVGDFVDGVVDEGQGERDEGDAQTRGDEHPPAAGEQGAVVAGPVEVGAPATTVLTSPRPRNSRPAWAPMP